MTQERTSAGAGKSRIPAFRSTQEEAEWWDSHDITDYLDELTPATNPFAVEEATSITVPLDPDALSKLERQASKRGVPPPDLAREWIEERLRSA